MNKWNKKILILCDYFPPAFAPRMGYLAANLKSYGWASDIITENFSGSSNFGTIRTNGRIIRVPLSFSEVPKNCFGKLLNFIFMEKRYFRNRKPFINAVIENNLNEKDYSLVMISTAWNLFLLTSGFELATRWGIPFIADLRDIHEQNPVRNPVRDFKSIIISWRIKLFTKKVLLQRNKILTRAFAVTTVSPFHVKILGKYNSNTKLIYNGFDSKLFYPSFTDKQPVFRIIYIGSIVDKALRDPTLAFRATKLLIQRDNISSKRVIMEFYIDENDRNLIKECPEYHDLMDFVYFRDQVNHSSIPGIINRAAILLLLANSSGEKGPKGILTTKLFEYFAVQKPVLCVRSDGSFIKEIIEEAGAGLAADNEEEAYSFIKSKYIEWENHGYTSSNYRSDIIMQYSRGVQTEEFIKLFDYARNSHSESTSHIKEVS